MKRLSTFFLSLFFKGTLSALVNIETVCPGILLDIRYATSHNFLGYPVYPFACCYLHEEVASSLHEVQQELASQGLGLLIYDGYRPLSVQQIMWDAVQDERYISNPAVNKGRHTRGTAVDLTLVDQSGNPLEMPTDFDAFTESAAANFMGASPEALANRTLLREAMERHHFQTYHGEWWHFDYEGWKDDQRFPALDIPFDELLHQ